MTRGWVRHRLGEFSLDVRWSVGQGEILALFGPSGAGKSMTLRAIAGLLRPDEGQVEVGARTVFDSRQRLFVAPHRRRAGYMAQDYGLFPHMTVWRNVAFALQGAKATATTARVSALLDALHIRELAARFPSQLSRGQQQRVALARALARQPAVLLLDEPFSAVDVELRRALRQELRAFRDREGVPIILVTHDPDDALALGDRVLALDQGRVVAEGSPLEVLQRPPVARLSRLVDVENVLEGRVAATDARGGTTTCDLGGVALEIAYAALPVGARVRVGVRAGDIILATQAPRGLSARNILQGSVVALVPAGFEVHVRVDCGVPLVATVTPRAVESLALSPGATVWLVIKSNSCFLIDWGGRSGA